MRIRIESEHVYLKEINQLIYESDPEFQIDEDYSSTPGMQREPVLIALISVTSPIVIAAIRSWVQDRKNKREAELEKAKLETERERIRMVYDLAKTRLILEEGEKKIIEISAEEVEKLDNYLPPIEKNDHYK